MQRPGRFATACALLIVLAPVVGATAQAAGNVAIGREATVDAPGGLNVRNDPGPQAEVLTTASDGDFVHVVAGPRFDGGEEWYAVEYERAWAGVYPLQVAMRWDDSYGNTFNDATSLGIPIGDGPSRPVISVTGSRLPSRVAPGVPFQVALDVVNTGGQEARNLVASPLAGPLSSVGSGGSGPINLAPGGSATLVLALMACRSRLGWLQWVTPNQPSRPIHPL